MKEMKNKALVIAVIHVLFISVIALPVLFSQAGCTSVEWSNKDVVLVSAGYKHYLAVTADGNLWAWGNNDLGQLGIGKRGGYIEEKTYIMNNVVYASAGNDHSLAIRTDGSLWVWGDNLYGQLGNGKHDSGIKVLDYNPRNYKPKKIMEDVVTASAGFDATMAVKKDGSLWGWGDYLSLYRASNFSHEPCINENPVKIMEDVAAVSMGWHHSLILKTDGSLWGLGRNEMGVVGDGTREDRSEPVKVLEDVIAFTAGVQQSLAVTSDGSMWAWGTDGASFCWYVEGQEREDVADVAAGGYGYSLALKTDGTLLEWNWFGGSYDGKEILRDVKMISAGEHGYIALTKDGRLWEYDNPARS